MSMKIDKISDKFKKTILVGVVVVATAVAAFIVLPGVMAGTGDYTITYNTGSTSYVKSYPAGTVTLDALPSGAIAWTNDTDSSAPNGKMAYVNYSHTETVNGAQVPINIPMTLMLNGNITLNANFGSYANGLGPRLIQYHLELKFFDMTNNVMMQYEQHYASVNAPAGYYVDLPPSNYFGTLYSQVNNSGGLVNTGQVISNWVNDSSYTGTTNEPQSLIYTPDQAIFVDPNNYNQVYDAMVTSTYNPSFAQTLPPDAPANPTSPDPVPTNADDSVTFRISQANIPPASIVTNLSGNSSYPVYGGTFIVLWDTDHAPNRQLQSTPTNVYLNWFSGSTQLTLSGLQDTQTWAEVLPSVNLAGTPEAVLPVAITVSGYSFYWDMDGTKIDCDATCQAADTSLVDYMDQINVGAGSPIGGSHVFTLHYVPIPTTVQLYIDGHTNSVVYDGGAHSVTGYDVYDCSGVAVVNIDQDNLSGSGCTKVGENTDGSATTTLDNGDVLNFANTSGNSNVTAIGTDVGTYPMVLMASDFSVNNSATGDLYNLTMSNGGLTITQKDLPIIITPPIDPNTPGDQTVVVTPSNPGDLAPGHEIITPGTGITDNGGTSTTDGNTDVVVNVDGDGNITYIDPNTGNPIPYDPTQPNGGVIWIGDTNNNDPNTGLPTNVTGNYTPSNVLPGPTTKNNNNTPGAPNTGIDTDSVVYSISQNPVYIACILIPALIVVGMVARVIKKRI